MRHGTFAVKVQPLTPRPPRASGRYSIDKKSTAILEATSKGEMFGGGDYKQGTAGYVAIEVITGTLGGKTRQLRPATLQHHGPIRYGAGDDDDVHFGAGLVHGAGVLQGEAAVLSAERSGNHFDGDIARGSLLVVAPPNISPLLVASRSPWIFLVDGVAAEALGGRGGKGLNFDGKSAVRNGASWGSPLAVG